MPREVVVGVLQEQVVDVDDVALYEQVVRALPQLIRAREITQTNLQANSLNAAELPSADNWPAMRVATSLILLNLPMAL